MKKTIGTVRAMMFGGMLATAFSCEGMMREDTRSARLFGFAGDSMYLDDPARCTEAALEFKGNLILCVDSIDSLEKLRNIIVNGIVFKDLEVVKFRGKWSHPEILQIIERMLEAMPSLKRAWFGDTLLDAPDLPLYSYEPENPTAKRTETWWIPKRRQ
ncbi:MAG: hypothetical protein LBC04_00905 [Holosporaceae bacterium]|nr:hypothetical protein [Holosporaceae bacterium]